MQETRKSLILHLTKENWQQELQDANISDLAKEKLRSALNVKLNGMGKMPSITEGQFNKIVKQEVFFVKVGNVG